MKVLYSTLTRLHRQELEETIVYSDEQISSIISLLRMSPVKVKVFLEEADGIVHANFKIKVDLVLECAYSLEEVDYPLDFEDEIDFLFVDDELKQEDETLIYIDSNTLELEPYILGLIITEIPSRVIKEGATLPRGGKGYEVITEEEYYERHEENVDPRFAGLDDFDLDE